MFMWKPLEFALWDNNHEAVETGAAVELFGVCLRQVFFCQIIGCQLKAMKTCKHHTETLQIGFEPATFML